MKNPSSINDIKTSSLLTEQLLYWFEFSSDLLTLIDEKGYFTLVNPSFERVLGWTPEEMTSKPYIYFVHPDDIEATLHVNKNLIEGGNVVKFENRYLRKDGQYHWLKWDAFIMPDKNTSVCVAKDYQKTRETLEKLDMLKSAIESTFEGIVITGHISYDEAPEILFVNSAFEKLFGYTQEELLGKPHTLFSGPETDLTELNKFLAKNNKTNAKQLELLCYKKNGEKFWARVSLSPIFDSHGKCANWVSSYSDRTKENKQIKLLEESEQKFRSLAQDSIVGIHIINREKYVYVNNVFARNLGYTPEEIYQLQLKDFFHPDDFPLVLSKVENRLSGEITNEHYDIRMLTKSGSIRWMEIFGSTTLYNDNPAVIGTTIDITLKKEKDNQLRKLSRIIDQTESSILITDLNGRIEYVNPAFTQLTGYTLAEAIGQNPRILKTEKTGASIHQEMWKELGQNRSWKGVFCNKKKNGEEFWEQAVISPVFNENGIKLNYVAINKDITQRVKLEREKELLIEELSTSLEELKKFSYITSHNFRAPVTNLLGIIDLLDTSLIADPTTLTLIEGFKRSTLKLNETLEDLIETVVLRDHNKHIFEWISFENILEKACLNLNLSIQNSKTQMEANFEHARGGIFIGSFMESIFQNFIANSIKFAIPNQPLYIKINSKLEGETLTLTFEDNGLGMNLSKVKDKLFGLYQKFHKNDDSKGIGLYIVKSHVNAMRGVISVKSEINKGTTFTMKFKQ
ncbi:MAG: PAS domain S-box protein [bacterium]|nr:PAS domain S-box protein [bacterium]